MVLFIVEDEFPFLPIFAHGGAKFDPSEFNFFAHWTTASKLSREGRVLASSGQVALSIFGVYCFAFFRGFGQIVVHFDTSFVVVEKLFESTDLRSFDTLRSPLTHLIHKLRQP